jgi:hypothetical protein
MTTTHVHRKPNILAAMRLRSKHVRRATKKPAGNDGAHQGTLTKEEAYDLLDFTTALLERVFTEPEKIKLAEERRQRDVLLRARNNTPAFHKQHGQARCCRSPRLAAGRNP